MGEIRKKIFHVKLKTGKFSKNKLQAETSNKTQKNEKFR